MVSNDQPRKFIFLRMMSSYLEKIAFHESIWRITLEFTKNISTLHKIVNFKYAIEFNNVITKKWCVTYAAAKKLSKSKIAKAIYKKKKSTQRKAIKT